MSFAQEPRVWQVPSTNMLYMNKLLQLQLYICFRSLFVLSRICGADSVTLVRLAQCSVHQAALDHVGLLDWARWQSFSNMTQLTTFLPASGADLVGVLDDIAVLVMTEHELLTLCIKQCVLGVREPLRDRGHHTLHGFAQLILVPDRADRSDCRRQHRTADQHVRARFVLLHVLL